MQAITTRYAGPTDHNGSRIIARCDAGRRTFAWNYLLGVEDNHHSAALAFARELGWMREGDGWRITSGSIAGQGGYAHVLSRSGE